MNNNKHEGGAPKYWVKHQEVKNNLVSGSKSGAIKAADIGAAVIFDVGVGIITDLAIGGVIAAGSWVKNKIIQRKKKQKGGQK